MPYGISKFRPLILIFILFLFSFNGAHALQTQHELSLDKSDGFYDGLCDDSMDV